MEVMIKYIRWLQTLTAVAASVSWLFGAQWWALATALEAAMMVWILTDTGKTPNVISTSRSTATCCHG